MATYGNMPALNINIIIRCGSPSQPCGRGVYSIRTLEPQRVSYWIWSVNDNRRCQVGYKDAFYRWNGIDVPVFWRIPRSASGVIEATMTFCYGLTLANALGAGFQDEVCHYWQHEMLNLFLCLITNPFSSRLLQTLHITKVPAGAEYVNDDVSTPKGLEAAAELDLASSGLADVISNNCHSQRHSCSREMLHAALASCWSSSITIPFLPKGRRLYHKSTQQYFDMTIDEFAEAVAENNWMVRFQTGKRSGTVSWHDLETAKEVFGRKCLVGLADRAEESFRRYKQFFRWDQNVPNNA